MLTNITFILRTHAAYSHLFTQSELLQQVNKVRRVFSGASARLQRPLCAAAGTAGYPSYMGWRDGGATHGLKLVG